MSVMVKAPAAASAEYSPSEWPATNCASRLRSTPASASSTRMTASDTAISAGCAFSVSVSLSAGPSHMIAVSLSPSAASTSSNTARAGAKALRQRLAHADRLAALAGNTKAAVIFDPQQENRAGRGCYRAGVSSRSRSGPGGNHEPAANLAFWPKPPINPAFR